MRIFVKWCGLPWCMFAGSWLFQGLDVDKYVKDATPVVPPEPIVELKGADNDVIRRLLNELRLLISLASITAWIKKLGLRVFIHGSALPDPVNDFVRAALAGGVDGLVAGDFVKMSVESVNIVSTSAEGSPTSYVMVDSLSIGANVPKSYGVILMNAPTDREWLIGARDSLKALGVKEVFVALGADQLRPDLVKNITDVLDGVVIMEVPVIVSLGFDERPAYNVFRCSNCYIDFETSGEIRKCPRCSGRVRPIIKPWGRYVVLEDRVLRLKGLEEIKTMRLDPPKTIYL
ncbi:MAG: hypothetical protein L7H10_04695 [Vulcanisaeta sp.]|nr:hypothetical protein [Vulcanisaeta sp.]MCG2886864.1 hypothetical protein [Vulcanisaeta sp.]